MKTRAAILRQTPGLWEIEELELDPPGPGEVLVKMIATGLCHSDDHVTRGDLAAARLPLVGGHEGAGVVRQVGSDVQGLEVGDHIVTSFVPSCGRCRWCAMGMQNLCDNGALIRFGTQLDGTCRLHDSEGVEVSTTACLGTFSEWQVFDQMSCIKVDVDLPLEVACLVSCGVQTGYGSVKAGDVQPGDVVLVIGVGGIGMNAVQGARDAGAAHVIAVDPVAAKRGWAADFGATAAYESVAAAMPAVAQLTNGQGADVAILCVGVVRNDLVGQAYQAVRKAGTLVVTGIGPATDDSAIPGVNAVSLAMQQKRIQGALYGMKSPREAVPMLLTMYRAGKLKLDELITRTYSLDEINEGYRDLHEGKNIRGVITFAD